MKIVKVSTAFYLIFVFCLALNAQNLPSQQIEILNNPNVPFENGKTIISEVTVLGLDKDYNVLDYLSHRKLIPVKGDYFKGGNISKAVKFIKEELISEGFNEADVKAFGEFSSGNQMKLIFQVDKGKLAEVLEIRFDGNQNIKNEELDNVVKKCLGNDWRTFVEAKYEYIVNTCIRNLLSGNGYFLPGFSKIYYENKTVLIGLKEGICYQLGQIDFKGLEVFSKSELLEMLNLKTGDVANGKRINDFFYEELSKLYKNRGYLLYDVDIEPVYLKPQTEGENGVVNFTIFIDEGKQFKIKKISIVCSDLSKIGKIMEMLGIAPGEIYNEEAIQNGIKRINQTKEFKPIDFHKDIELKADEETDEIDLIIKVDKK